MPQHISIAIVCTDTELLMKIRRKLKVSAPGVAPKFYLVTLNKPKNRIINYKKLPKNRITQWIALDDESLQLCKKLHESDLKSKSYDRGFYNESLPDHIIEIKQELSEKNKLLKLEEQIKIINIAFCESS